MKQKEFLDLMDSKLKLIRTEYCLTQDKMAAVIGLSKKTLVEIEKGRRRLSWSAAVAVTTIFSDSEVLQDSFGGELSDLIKAIAFDDMHVSYPKTMGGKVWWRTTRAQGEYKIQQNIISKHYRIIDDENRRYFSSFDIKETVRYLEELK